MSDPKEEAAGAELTLSAPGPRAVVTVDEARQIRSRWLRLLAAAAPPGSRVVKIDIGCRVWSMESLKALFGDDSEGRQGTPEDENEEASLAFLFSKIRASLRELKVDDITATLPTEQGLQSLGYLSDAFAKFEWPSLATVNLNDTAVGLRGIQALHSLWRIPSLRHLHLQNIGLSAESIDLFVDYLLPPPPPVAASSEQTGAAAAAAADDKDATEQLPSQPVPYQTLSLGRNQLGVKGSQGVARILRNCYQLQHLEYAGCRPLREGMRSLMEGLLASNSHGTIRALNLNDSELKRGSRSDDPVHALGRYLSMTTELETLVVSDTSLSSRGINILLNGLLSSSSAASLQHLDVGYNVDDDDDDEDDDEDSEDEEGNEEGGDEEEDGASPPSVRSARAVARAAAQFPRLQQLHLHNNDLKDDGVRIVVQALAARAASAAATADADATLHVLNLSENGMATIDSLLEHPIAGLRELRLADNFDLEESVDDDQKDRLGGMYPAVLWEAVEEAFDVGGGGSAPTSASGASVAGQANAEDVAKEEDETLARALDSVHLG
jgi:hypothetical protein